MKAIASTLAALVLVALPIEAPAAEPEAAATGDTKSGASEAVPSDTLDDEFKLISELTVTAASKHVQLLSEAPSSVTIVTSEEIERYGYLTLGDLLDSVRGFYVSDDRNYTYLGVRGFARPGDYNTRVLFLLNGHTINENLYDSTAMFGPETGLDLSTVDHVEIVRGPGSSLYGTNALFAVVNVITKTGSQTDGGHAQALGGNQGRYGAGFNFGERTATGIDLRVSGILMRSSGEDIYFSEFDDPALNSGVADGLDGESSWQGTLQVASGHWRFQSYLCSRIKEVPTASYGTEFNNDAYTTTDSLGFADLAYSRRLGRTAEISARVYYDNYRYEGIYPIPGPPTVLNDDIGKGWWTGEEVSVAWQTGPSHRLTIGQGFEATVNGTLRNFDQDPYWSYLNTSRSFNQWSAYVQDEWRASARFTLGTGARVDAYTGHGVSFSPRVAAIINPAPATTLKLLAGTAYRAPNVYEQYYADGVTVAPAPSLDPEHAHSYEMILERLVSQEGIVSLSVFRNEVRGLITPVLLPSGLSRFENDEQATTSGIEAGGRLSTRSGLMGYASFAYTSGEDSDGAWLTNSPRQIAKAGMSIPLVPRTLFVSPEYRYVGARRTLDGDSTPSAGTADLTLLWRLGSRERALSLSVANLFDAETYSPGSLEHVQDQIIQPGRRVYLRFRTDL
jgi:iron complex outermembrane receptor protein